MTTNVRLTLRAGVVCSARHCVQLFACGCASAALVVAPDQAGVLTLPTAQPCLLLCRWYADETDSDGVVAQEFVAHGVVRDGVARMLDICGQEQGCVEVQGAPAQVAEAPMDMAFCDLVTEQVRAALDASGATSHFVSVSTHLDRVRSVPLLLFALQAQDVRWDAQDAPRLFLHLMRLAERFAHPSQTADGDILADMIASPSLGWVYRADHTLGLRAHSADCWSSILSFPDAHAAAFDCEDGAKALVELFLVFRGMALPDACDTRLRRLHGLAQLYTPFMVIGEIHSPASGNYGLHCYAALVDARSVDEPHGAHFEDTITLESTMQASGCWRAGMRARLRADAQLHAETWRAVPPQLASVALVHESMAIVADRALYGRVMSIFTASHRRAGALHALHLVPQHSALAAAFFLDRCPLTVAFSMPADQLRARMSHQLSFAPASVVPRAPALTQLPCAIAGAVDVLFPRPLVRLEGASALEAAGSLQVTNKMSIGHYWKQLRASKA